MPRVKKKGFPQTPKETVYNTRMLYIEPIKRRSINNQLKCFLHGSKNSTFVLSLKNPYKYAVFLFPTAWWNTLMWWPHMC